MPCYHHLSPCVVAYLKFLVAIEKGFQQNHHVRSHHCKVFSIGSALVHVTESRAHRIIHKEETGSLELCARGKANAAVSRLTASPSTAKPSWCTEATLLLEGILKRHRMGIEIAAREGETRGKDEHTGNHSLQTGCPHNPWEWEEPHSVSEQ